MKTKLSCILFGHHWTERRYITLYLAMRKCLRCGKVETKNITR